MNPPCHRTSSTRCHPAVQAYIRYLEARLADLEARLNQNSSNSSKPPSSDGPQVEPAPPKKGTGKRRGGQPGHPKRARPELPPDTVVELRPGACEPPSLNAFAVQMYPMFPFAYPTTTGIARQGEEQVRADLHRLEFARHRVDPPG